MPPGLNDIIRGIVNRCHQQYGVARVYGFRYGYEGLVQRFGHTPLLFGGLATALVGVAWLSRLTEGTSYFPQIAIPLALVGAGMGIAFAPLTAAGIAGVAQSDAGAGISVVIVYCPLDSAAAAVTILNADPGGYVFASGRFSNGWLGSLV